MTQSPLEEFKSPQTLSPQDALALERWMQMRNSSSLAKGVISSTDADSLDDVATHLPIDSPSIPTPPSNDDRLAQMDQLMATLNTCATDEPATDLTAKTLVLIEQNESTFAAMRAGEMPSPLRFSMPSFRLVEFLVAAAIIAIAATLTIPMLANLRSSARRFACQTNLGIAGVAFSSYASDYQDALPRLQLTSGSAWYNVGKVTPEGHSTESNSANLYLLIREGYLATNDLSCPENKIAPRYMTAQMHDWPTYETTSYSYQNQFRTAPLHLQALGSMTILADKNPLFRVYADNLLQRDYLPKNTPSIAHDGQGQNILSADGQARWFKQPIKDNDNIWLIEGVTQYNGTETPQTETDTFLVP